MSVDENKSLEDFDLVVVGGGMVGVSMLRALAHTSYRIAFIEAVSFRSPSPPSFDDRIIALSQSSSRIFNNLNLWQDIESQCCPIRHIHVSDQGHFGVTRLHAQDYKLDALGYVATAKQLGSVLIQDLQQQHNLRVFQPAQVIELKQQSDGYHIQIRLGEAPKKQDTHHSAAAPTAPTEAGELVTLSCRLLIAADGDNSTIRQLLDIPVQRVDYQQHALVANIQCQRDHQNVAYERFTRHGPLALLPMRENSLGLVWTHRREHIDERMALSDQAFCQQLQAAFGRRLGALHSVGKRVQFPLNLSYPQSPIAPRLVLIGNAAHTLHPVAGQGFNLGMRDVAVLAQLLEEADIMGRDPGDSELLAQYAEWRKPDHQSVIRFTHALVLGFSNALAPVTMARGMGLLLTDIVSPIKRYLATSSMGLQVPQPKLMLQAE